MNDNTFNLTADYGRDFAIMFVREVRCHVIGINDPTIYDAAMVALLPQELRAMQAYNDQATGPQPFISDNVRVWRFGEVVHVDDIADRTFPDRVYDYENDSIVMSFERCETLHANYCASDFFGSFFQFAYQDMINSIETDHGRMVRAVNHINMRIGKAPIRHVMSTADLGSLP